MIKKPALISQTLITVSDSIWEIHNLWEMWSWLDRKTTLWNKPFSSLKVKKAWSCTPTYTSSLRTVNFAWLTFTTFIENIHHWEQNLTRCFTNCFTLLNHVRPWIELTLILLTWKIWWASNNASKWHMGFNSVFKGLRRTSITLSNI